MAYLPVVPLFELCRRFARACVARAPVGLSALLAVAALAAPAAARCVPVAQGPGDAVPPLAVPAGYLPVAETRGPALPAGTVELTFLGHASFLIRTHGNTTAITDYNGYNRAPFPPDVVTMNYAHSTHFTLNVEPGVKHVLKGWAENGVIPRHNVTEGDLHVTNVPTNIRDGAVPDSGIAGNSIFIFKSAGLCVVHLGHLHHRLKPSHAARVGSVDVLLAAIDDSYTMAQSLLVKVIDDLKPQVVIPMHYGYSGDTLAQFIATMREKKWAIRVQKGASARFTKVGLPDTQTVVVLEGRGF